MFFGTKITPSIEYSIVIIDQYHETIIIILHVKLVDISESKIFPTKSLQTAEYCGVSGIITVH